MERIENSLLLTAEIGKDIGLQYLCLVKEFLKNLNKLYPHLNKDLAITELEELEDRINGKSNSLSRQIEVDGHFQRSLHEIINCRDSISRQLHTFWNAHMEIAQIAVDRNISYHPKQIADENRDKILQVNQRYHEMADIIVNTKTDNMVLIYALFFIHNLRTEVIEFSFVQQFRNILRDMNISTKYDPEEIFSVTNKVLKGDKWKTDARAIRDALSHNKFSITTTNTTWKIEFNNTEEGYNFQKSFTGEEFRKFMTDTDFLYRSSLMLIFSLISMTLIKQHCIQPKD